MVPKISVRINLSLYLEFFLEYIFIIYLDILYIYILPFCSSRYDVIELFFKKNHWFYSKYLFKNIEFQVTLKQP